MKKSLIALAVVSAFAAPAFAATSNVDVYGALGISIEDNDSDNSDLQVTDRQSRIGFKGTEDLGGGLKAIWQIEQAISASASGQDGVGGATLANRNSFVGLSGGFGTVLMGRHDTPYKMSTGSLDIFADTVADWNVAEGFDLTTTATIGSIVGAATVISPALIDPTHDLRSAAAIAYVSPNFSGFSFAAAVVATNNPSAVSISTAGAVGAGNLNSGDNLDAYSLSGTYANGPLFLTVGYQDAKVIDSQALKIGAGYSFGDLKLGAVYENVENSLVGGVYVAANASLSISSGAGALVADRDTWLVNAAYTMGPIVLKAEYGQLDIEDLDVDKWALGADYNLSKRTNVYAVYTKTDVDGSEDVGAWALGVRHSF